MGNYSLEYKAEICKRIIDGEEKLASVCAEQNLKENIVRGWIKDYKAREGKSFVGSGNIKPEDAKIKRL